MPTHSSRVSVLLVEDSDDDAFFFRWALQRTNVACDLVHLTDGAAAIEYLDGPGANPPLRPDVVFLDLKLPKRSGFDVLTWIGGRGRSLHVVVLSGSEQATDLERAQVLGAASYVVKPIGVTALRDQLDRVRPSRSVDMAKVGA